MYVRDNKLVTYNVLVWLVIVDDDYIYLFFLKTKLLYSAISIQVYES